MLFAVHFVPLDCIAPPHRWGSDGVQEQAGNEGREEEEVWGDESVGLDNAERDFKAAIRLQIPSLTRRVST